MSREPKVQKNVVFALVLAELRLFIHPVSLDERIPNILRIEACVRRGGKRWDSGKYRRPKNEIPSRATFLV